MSLVVLYLGTRYDVCECNSMREMTISSFLVTFDLRLWPSLSVKVTFISFIWWTLCCCALIASTKFVGSIEFEIWTIVYRKFKWRQNDVIAHSIFMKFKHKSTMGVSKRHTFILIKHKRAEIQYYMEVNRELWRKKKAITSLWFWSLTQGHQIQ